MIPASKLIPLASEILVGFGDFCGMEILSMDNRRMTARMPLRKEFRNVHGFAHGGIIDTLMDTASGVLATFASDPVCRVVTRSADIHFVRPLDGAYLQAEAQVIKCGRTCCLVETKVYDDQGRVCTAGIFDQVYITLPGRDELIEKIRALEEPDE